MFTNQKVLGLVLFLLIIGGSIYFAFSKFKDDISSVGVTPSPSPVDLGFFNSKTPVQSSVPQNQNQTQQPQPQSSELPLSKNKKLSQFPGIVKPIEALQNKAVAIQTSKGMISLKIYPEATMAASNFLILASNGFYDGLVFHRVEDWVIQGGDPDGTGRGGPGYQFPDEQVTRPYIRGVVAMANSGPDTNGSQFFILKKDYPLEPKYTIFGQVIAGEDVIDKITAGDVMQKVIIQNLQ